MLSCFQLQWLEFWIIIIIISVEMVYHFAIESLAFAEMLCLGCACFLDNGILLIDGRKMETLLSLIWFLEWLLFGFTAWLSLTISLIPFGLSCILCIRLCCILISYHSSLFIQSRVYVTLILIMLTLSEGFFMKFPSHGHDFLDELTISEWSQIQF